jgi:hypothetical protein
VKDVDNKKTMKDGQFVQGWCVCLCGASAPRCLVEGWDCADCRRGKKLPKLNSEVLQPLGSAPDRLHDRVDDRRGGTATYKQGFTWIVESVQTNQSMSFDDMMNSTG